MGSSCTQSQREVEVILAEISFANNAAEVDQLLERLQQLQSSAQIHLKRTDAQMAQQVQNIIKLSEAPIQEQMSSAHKYLVLRNRREMFGYLLECAQFIL